MLDLSEPRIVASISNNIEQSASRAVDGKADIIEIRLDLIDGDALGDLESIDVEIPLIVTNRSRSQGGNYTGDEATRVESLLDALELDNVEFVDVELDMERSDIDRVVEQARSLDKSVIVSHHDFEETPPRRDLVNTLNRCSELGGIPKVAVTPRSPGDTLELLEATMNYSGDCCAISMGDIGRYTRVIAPLFGSKLTYGCLGEPVAPGQINTEELKRLLKLFGAL